MSRSVPTHPHPSPRIAGCEPYVSPLSTFDTDLRLNGNEGVEPPGSLFDAIRERFPMLLQQYPTVMELESLLARRFGLPRDQVLVTAGADDALYRACLALLAPDRAFVVPLPTFEMLVHYGRMAAGRIVEIRWQGGGYPTDAVIDAVDDDTALIAVVSPNNPTGATATHADLKRLSASAPHAILLVDLAYIEFAEQDLTPTALALPNAVAIRTLSKAWGLAGLRVGYALGPPDILRWLRAAGNPFAVSGVSASLAAAWLETGQPTVDAFAQRVRRERADLFSILRELGAEPLPSQANFVCARFVDAGGVWKGLARLGIAVRPFPHHPTLGDFLRITCPGNQVAFERLTRALRQVVGSSGVGERLTPGSNIETKRETWGA